MWVKKGAHDEMKLIWLGDSLKQLSLSNVHQAIRYILSLRQMDEFFFFFPEFCFLFKTNFDINCCLISLRGERRNREVRQK